MRKLIVAAVFMGMVATAMAQGISDVRVKDVNGGGWLVVTNGALKSAMVDSSGNSIGIDSNTRALETIDYAHHEIHAGSHYVLSVTDLDLDTGETNGVYIKTPNTTKYLHLVMSADSTKAANGFICEAPTAITTNAALTAYNNNRTSSNTSGADFADIGVVIGGTLIDEALFGSAGAGPAGVGGVASRINEYVLNSNTVYAIYVVGADDDGRLSMHLNWYEHTDY